MLARAILAAWQVPAEKDPDPRLLKLVEQKEKLLHNSWLSHVGHLRPGVATGLPLKVATQRAAALESQIVNHSGQ